MDYLVYWIWISLKNRILPKKVYKLVDYFVTIKGVYEANKEELMLSGILSDNEIKLLLDKSLSYAEREIKTAEKLSVYLISYDSKFYPETLKEINNPPVVLYAMGDLNVLKNRAAFCIVGTRHCTAYGMSAALGISQQLASCGMVIVSGLANGIDSAAHRGALRSNGKTIGVLGCGIDIIYPSGSEELREGILKNGVLLSEFPFKTPPYGANFPKRNRILSGLSLGVAVIEAGEKSGAIITATYALEQGKDVFALPGNISNPKSSGTNKLIQDGAALLSGADEILAEYISRYPEYFCNLEENTEKEPLLVIKEEGKRLSKSKIDGDEAIVYKVLGKEPVNIDDISRQTDLPVSKVNSILTVLQIKGLIKEHAGRNYTAS